MKKSFIKLLSFVAPNMMVNKAFTVMTKPRVIKNRQHEEEVLDTAKKSIYKYNDFDIQLYTWGTGVKKILLVHGWEGQAGNFADIITEFKNHNIQIIAFDGPSHGHSSKGGTNLFEFAYLVTSLIKKYSPNYVLSHSFGGVATTFGLIQDDSLSIEKYALLTTPDKFSERVDFVAEQVGITEKVKNRLINKFKVEFDIDPNISVAKIAPQLNIAETYIIHDKNDGIIPIDQSQRVANAFKTELDIIEGTGHFRILRTDFVHQKLIKFFNLN